MHLFNYLPAKIWHVLEAPTETRQNKLRHLAHFMVAIIGCRNPSAPTKVLAVARRKGVTLLTLSAFDMWGHAGFLARVFAPFAAHGVSVDLVATSQVRVPAAAWPWT